MQFKRPLTLEIQHFASLNSDHQQRLVFARATDQSKKFEILKMYSALLFSRKNLLCNDVVIDVKCVICWDLHTHLEVIGFLSDMRVACMHVFRS